MFAADLDAGGDHGDEGTDTEMRKDRRLGPVDAQILVHADVQDVHEATDDEEEQIEKPERKGRLLFDQIEETDHRETQPE